MLIGFVGVIVLIMIITIVILFSKMKAKSILKEKNPKEKISNNIRKHKGGTGSTELEDIPTLSLYVDNTNILVLVNKDNHIPEDYNANLRDICNGRLQASKVIYKDLVEMLSSADKEGYTYWIASAYRSKEKQQKLVDEDVRKLMNQGMTYDDALKKTYEETMPAGYSEHETGLALDILCSNNTVMDQEQEYEPGNQWLRQNSYKYGFILRYPKDKVEVTKINYEPWHFRYVGRKMAKKMYEEKITLEELIDVS